MMNNLSSLTIKLENGCFKLIDALADLFWMIGLGVYDAIKAVQR